MKYFFVFATRKTPEAYDIVGHFHIVKHHKYEIDIIEHDTVLENFFSETLVQMLYVVVDRYL